MLSNTLGAEKKVLPAAAGIEAPPGSLGNGNGFTNLRIAVPLSQVAGAAGCAPEPLAV